MKAVHILRFGGRMRYSELPIPKVPENHVLVKMHHAPINPSDLYYAAGVYGERKSLPAVIGFEGSGKIQETNLTGKYTDLYDKNQLLGSKVALMISRNVDSGTWGEYAVTHVDNVLQLQKEDSLLDYCSPMINPGTVAGFLYKCRELGADSAVVNAAFSQVGQMTLKTFKKNNIKFIGIVRDKTQAQKLEEMGAHKVFTIRDDNEAKKIPQVKELVNELKTKVFFDSVGGPSASKIFEVMPKKCTLVSYGAFDLKKFELDPQQFVFHQKQIEGFWLTRFLHKLSHEDRQHINKYIYSELQGDLKTNISKAFYIEDFQEAIFDYKANAGQGKNVLSI